MGRGGGRGKGRGAPTQTHARARTHTTHTHTHTHTGFAFKRDLEKLTALVPEIALLPEVAALLPDIAPTALNSAEKTTVVSWHDKEKRKKEKIVDLQLVALSAWRERSGEKRDLPSLKKLCEYCVIYLYVFIYTHYMQIY